ncbi:MAG: ABC transporter permease subunit [Chthoniobacterales bacterium]|nr:ABC transporter permease subunit [Chthoniobacterales bacterium]
MSAKKVRWNQVRHHWEIYLFILPVIALVALFQYYPAASGIFHSFYRWNGADVSEWVGFKNYTDLLGSPEFWQSFRVAFLLGVWNVVKMLPAIAVAVWIHRCRSERMQFLYRLLFVVPMVVPMLVVALIWRTFFFEATQGYLNWFLDHSGLFPLLCRLDQWLHWGGIFVEGTRPAWLGDPRLILVACVVWGFPWVGSFAVLTHLAKLQNIPREIYEAADIDGAGWWTKFTRIEAPLIMSSIHLMLVFVIIGTIKDAGMIIALTGGMEGGPGGLATVPALFMLRKAFVNQEMGAACAVGIVLTLVVMALQKLSTLLLDDTQGVGWLRRAARPAGLLLGVLLWFFAPGWGTIAVFLLLAAFPYGAVLALARRLVPARDAAPHRPRSPIPPALARLGSGFLRCAKHAGILGVLLIAFLPVILMLIVSLKTNQQFYEAPGRLTPPFQWNNWSDAWSLIAPSVANSLTVCTLSTALTLALALGGSYFFARLRVPLSGFLWNALLVLLMMPTVANLVPLFRLLGDLNLLNTLSALILVGASAGQVFAIFVLRNFVAEIPFDLFEAAEIDGANHFQQMATIVLPLCGPILGTVGVMHFITEWNEFVLPLIVIRDADLLPVMVQLQRLAGEYIKFFGPLMAGYALASLPIIVLFLFSMRLFTRGLTEGGTKG